MSKFWVIRTSHGAAAVDLESNKIVARFSEYGILGKAYMDWLDSVPGAQVDCPPELMEGAFRL